MSILSKIHAIPNSVQCINVLKKGLSYLRIYLVFINSYACSFLVLTVVKILLRKNVYNNALDAIAFSDNLCFVGCRLSHLSHSLTAEIKKHKDKYRAYLVSE